MFERLSPELQSKIEQMQVQLHEGFPFWLRPFMSRNVTGITLGRAIYISTAYATKSDLELERLFRHEIVHVAQMKAHGLLRFLSRYLSEWFVLLVQTRSFDEAYRQISFEQEAAAAEEFV